MDSPPPSAHDIRNFLRADHDDDDGDTASQRSISLSSPAASARNSMTTTSFKHSDLLAQLQPALSTSESSPSSRSTPDSKRESRPVTVDTEFSSEIGDDVSIHHAIGTEESPNTSAAPSVFEEESSKGLKEEVEDAIVAPATYPPTLLRSPSSDTESTTSMARKARPESVLLQPPPGKLVLGIVLVDFNHVVGPRVEWSKGEIFEDEEINKMLPFLALPDGAHLSAEDYSYFHVVPSGPNPTTLFGISCNQQIAASALLVKTPDVTRSTVQKAVVVLASKPLFGPIRDKLGVVTTALFQQRDFSETSILDQFEAGLELSLRGQLTESALYMGTNLRELIHTFRHRTLILLKALILQKRIMFYGHPVERLCTYQYSLICLIPGLLQTLDDCGSPPLASRAPTLSRPMSLRTSDPKSMMTYKGMPLDIFGKDAFFQPYLPLQQLDILKETKSWLCGSTNSIVTQQKEVDLLINTETGVFEFRNQKLERSTALTAADRKWIDDIVRDVNDTWEGADSSRSSGLQFKGSEDYLRVKFDEYISAALATSRYRDFAAKGDPSALMGGGLEYATSIEDFNPLWLSEFKSTNAYDVWERVTDPMLFDLVEPRHPCNEKVSVVSDIGLRLSEGIQDLKLEQQLAPAREAVQKTFTLGSASFFSAVQGVRDRWITTPTAPVPHEKDRRASGASTPVEVTKADLESSTISLESNGSASPAGSLSGLRRPSIWKKHTSTESTISIKSVNSTTSDNSQAAQAPKPGWGGFGGFMGRFSRSSSTMEAPVIPEEKPPTTPLKETSRPVPAPAPEITASVEEVASPVPIESPTTPRKVEAPPRFTPKPLNLSGARSLPASDEPKVEIVSTVSLDSPALVPEPKVEVSSTVSLDSPKLTPEPKAEGFSSVSLDSPKPPVSKADGFSPVSVDSPKSSPELKAEGFSSVSVDSPKSTPEPKVESPSRKGSTPSLSPSKFKSKFEVPGSSISSAKSRFESLSSSSPTTSPVRSKINIPAAFASAESKTDSVSRSPSPDLRFKSASRSATMNAPSSPSRPGGRPRSATRSRVDIPSAFAASSSPVNSSLSSKSSGGASDVPSVPLVPSLSATSPVAEEDESGAYSGMAL
ncbi:hypothetical protein K435DRAFT_775155 [Dendrothele bispora CBS 962.96]|uniref:UDENN domain-containing protein n=1 Tax=Dendrothele bispora (strain CBS 962.96) TaxID=1314807 RepID=A0A4S8ML71_DENBC|nr:hypothetical protein K435DRAFT_775155 [Dendrothele bispora CBS 962.96]